MIGISALNRWLIGLIIALICVVSPASAATIRLALDKRQVFIWDWTIFRSIEAAGKPKQVHDSATPVTLRVIERTRDGYLLEIQNGKTMFDPALQDAVKSDAAISSPKGLRPRRRDKPGQDECGAQSSGRRPI